MSDKPRFEEDRAAKATALFLRTLKEPEVQAVLEGDIRKRIAYLIRAELVCCDIYEKVAGPLDAMEEGKHSVAEHKASRVAFRDRMIEAKAAGIYHDICYYGEWAARLAETGDLPTGEICYGPWDMVAGKPAEPGETSRPKRDREPS